MTHSHLIWVLHQYRLMHQNWSGSVTALWSIRKPQNRKILPGIIFHERHREFFFGTSALSPRLCGSCADRGGGLFVAFSQSLVACMYHSMHCQCTSASAGVAPWAGGQSGRIQAPGIVVLAALITMRFIAFYVKYQPLAGAHRTSIERISLILALNSAMGHRNCATV